MCQTRLVRGFPLRPSLLFKDAPKQAKEPVPAYKVEGWHRSLNWLCIIFNLATATNVFALIWNLSFSSVFFYFSIFTIFRLVAYFFNILFFLKGIQWQFDYWKFLKFDRFLFTTIQTILYYYLIVKNGYVDDEITYAEECIQTTCFATLTYIVFCQTKVVFF